MRGVGVHSGALSDAPLPKRLPRLDWVISGSESGNRARPANHEWYRAVKSQCVDGHVAYFHKQEVEKGRKISTPAVDGARWVQFPA
jgi:protein gp37